MKKQRSKKALLADLHYRRQSLDLNEGMIIMLLIVIWLLWKSYEWEPEAINEFHDLTSKWMAHYYFGKITEEDMIGMIQAINDELGIDLTERVLLKEDMLDETPG